jgi:hypothetical protein
MILPSLRHLLADGTLRRGSCSISLSQLPSIPALRRLDNNDSCAGLKFVLAVYDHLFACLQSAVDQRLSTVHLSYPHGTHFSRFIRGDHVGVGSFRSALYD